jgi:hypothetical protein
MIHEKNLTPKINQSEIWLKFKLKILFSFVQSGVHGSKPPRGQPSDTVLDYPKALKNYNYEHISGSKLGAWIQKSEYRFG